MKGTFSENRPYLEHEYEHPHWNAESGLCAPALRQALRGFIEENLMLPMPLLRAKALDFLLTNVQIELNPHTPFADKLNLGIDYSDYAGQDLFAEEMYHRFHREVLTREMPEDFARRNQAERLGICTADADFWHTLPEWPNLLRLGFGGLLQRTEDAMSQKRTEGTLTAEAEIFYQSVILSYRAILNYIRRLREASARMEMPEYTACLDALLQGPPRTLYQALEACMIFMNVEEIGVERARSFGRADQLWYPFYRSDLDTGRATEEEIKEFLRYFYIRLQAGRRYADQPFSICGVDENGEDATNALSWLLLDVYDGMNIHNPKIHVCCSEKTPKALLLRVLDMIRRGNSSFVFINDEVVWRGYERIGIPLSEARGYVPFGCYEPILMGREEPMIGASWLNMAKAAELVMHGGRDTLTGERMFSQTPEDFSDFASFKAAFYTLLGDIIDFTMDNILKQDRFHMQINPSPVYSGSLTSCIEKGRDIFDGGTKYHNTSIKCCGIATAADCLLAVKTLVFERGLVRFPELSAILQANWEGHETLRRIAKSSPLKYGNHIPEADALAAEIYRFAAERIVGKKNRSGGVFRMGCDSITNCVVFGKKMGATPDGRLCAEPTSKNFSASTGMDRNGVTALIGSVTALDSADFVNGAVLDIVLHPSAVEGARGLEAMHGLLRTYFDLGGYALQGNVMDLAQLLDAKAHPEKYPTLQVRVCGWNEYFVELSPDMQDMFIRQLQEGA